MASHTQKGSVAIDAYQWPGTSIAAFTAGTGVATWLKALALQQASDNTLHVPCSNGTFRANPTDWVVRHPDNTVSILSNSTFTALYS